MANFHVNMKIEPATRTTKPEGWFTRTTVHQIHLLLIDVTVSEEALAKVERAGLMDSVLFTFPTATYMENFLRSQGDSMGDIPYFTRTLLTVKPIHIECDHLQQAEQRRTIVHAKLAELSRFLDTVTTTPPPESFEV